MRAAGVPAIRRAASAMAPSASARGSYAVLTSRRPAWHGQAMSRSGAAPMGGR